MSFEVLGLLDLVAVVALFRFFPGGAAVGET